MTIERLRRLRKLLGEALALPDGERAAFVAAATGDPTLASELAELLAIAEHDDPHLEPPVTTGPPTDRPSPGHRIGPWQLERCIGQGGMGEVWLAIRADGAFAQRVAIKMPRAARLGPGAISRFERERALLAGLEDPGIARLVDGGWAEGGRPWLAMEYVQGEPIDRHAKNHRLGTGQRVRLVMAACRALAAAHRQRIVHRDLKPGNVLVRDDGHVVLVDFGIATALDQDAATTVGLLATPAYCAPEQLRGAAATTAADVYSMATLARELVDTGDPDLAAVFDAATQVDPQRRTPSIDMFAADLQRWTDLRPVEARRASTWHLLRLRWRRSPGAAAALATLAALAVGLLVVAVVSWRAEHAERERAAAANVAKDHRLAQVRSLVRELVFGVHDRIAPLPGAVPARAFVVERAEQHLAELAEDASDDPGIANEVIETLLRLAEVRGARTYGHLGDFDGARRSVEAAVALTAAWRARQPTDDRWLLLMARGQRLAGDLARNQGRTADARTAYAAARSALDTMDISAPNAERTHTDAALRLQLARLDVEAGDLEQGLAALHQVLARFDELAAANPADVDAARNAALALNEQGLALSQLGRHGDAAAAFLAAISRFDTLCAAHAADAQLNRDRIETRLELALTLASGDDTGAAGAQLELALAAARTLLAQDTTNVLSARLVHRGLLHGARIAALRRDLTRTSELYRQAESLLRTEMQRGDEDPAVRRDLAEALIGSAEADRLRGADADVVATFAAGLTLIDADAALRAGDHRAGNMLTMAWIGLGHAAMAAGDVDAAHRQFADARPAAAAWAAAHPSLPWPLPHLAAVEHGLGLTGEALGDDESQPLEQRIQHLQEAEEAFTRGLTVARQLLDAGRLRGADKAMPRLLEMDVARVTAARQRLAAAAR